MRRLFATIPMLLLVATAATAQERTGPVVLRVPASAWALALGNGVTAIRGPSEMLFYNPSALAQSTGSGLSLQRWGGAATAASLSHAVTSSGWGIGVGVRYLDYGAEPGVLPHPTELGAEGPGLASSLAATVGLARVVKGFRVGVAASYVEERHPGDRTGFGVLDVGAGRTMGRFDLGLAVRNLGPDRVVEATAFETPLHAAIGVFYRPPPVGVFFDASALGEVRVDREGRVDASAGGELTWVPLEGWAVALRAAVRTVERVGDAGARPFTAGLGVSLDRFSLDYALDPQRGGVAHRLGVRMR